MITKKTLTNCTTCPRRCGVDRTKKETGYCRSGSHPLVASVCVHQGEEPVISGEKGICNLFFAHCNLQCVYCQNHQISKNDIQCSENEISIELLVSKIIQVLDSEGIDMLGFVSPSHFALQMIDVIDNLHQRGYYPTVVYNSNGYDSEDMLEQLADYVDVYLPDFKYADNDLGRRFSDVSDYFDQASKALNMIYRQKGSKLQIDQHGLARNGLIVRHLVLPGQVENSKKVLETIATIDPDISISLMAQYYPPFRLPFEALNRTLYNDEYEEVIDFMMALGLENGWCQELESASGYRPDFEQEHPFE